jgi:hypothetical protein
LRALSALFRPRKSWQRNDGRLLIALLVLLAAAFAIGLTYERVETSTRTGSASVVIEAERYQPGRPMPDVVTNGTWLTYSYRVAGHRYSAVTFRKWFDVDSHHPKVCYDPANPSDHLLVDGSERCGG